MANALGLKSEGGNAFMRTVTRKGIRSVIDENLWAKIENPIVFKPLISDLGHGYDADVLVDVCKAVIRAAEKDKLTTSQDPLVAQARILLQAFAKVGVAALIDEATGYQKIRSPDALRIS